MTKSRDRRINSLQRTRVEWRLVRWLDHRLGVGRISCWAVDQQVSAHVRSAAVVHFRARHVLAALIQAISEAADRI